MIYPFDRTKNMQEPYLHKMDNVYSRALENPGPLADYPAYPAFLHPVCKKVYHPFKEVTDKVTVIKLSTFSFALN